MIIYDIRHVTCQMRRPRSQRERIYARAKAADAEKVIVSQLIVSVMSSMY